MGYTHYWNTGEASNKNLSGYKQALPDLRVIFEKYREVLDEDSSVGETGIFINGKGSDGCEGFYFPEDYRYFNFCKTRRKPYDHVVCLMVLVLDRYIPDFNFRSDGIRVGMISDEWRAAAADYIALFGRREEVEKFL